MFLNHQKHDAFRVYMAFAFFWRFSLTLAFTIDMVYLVQVIGLDALQMVLVGTALELSAFLCEIPTGVIADTYSRRLSIIIGAALMGLNFFVFTIPTFAAVLLSQVIMGLGWTFISGAENAWLADEIGEKAAANAYIRSSQIGQIASVAGIIFSVGFALLDLRIPIVMGGISLNLLALYLLIFMPETGFSPAPKDERETFGSMIHTTRSGIQTIRAKPVLVTLMVIFFVWGAFSEGYDRLWTLHILENFNLPQLGEMDTIIWFGVISLVGMPINLMVTEYVRRRVQLDDQIAIARTLIRASTVLIFALLLFALAQQFWLALIAIWLVSATRNLTYPLRQAWINQGLDSKVRATVLSMTEQMDAVGQIVGGPGIGLIGRQFGVRIALSLGAVILAPVIALYGRTIRQNGQITTDHNIPKAETHA